ncbi:uncharacterized protein LOC142357814, partial [Convolutriloba macropyga]|uniref:uncharacterized protein LOC142357814 n=1 Tax=Convolutriloba macropyga TaxID=536237 RepID=UPI003F520B36
TFSVLSKWPVTHRLQDYLCIAPIIELHDPKTSSYIDYGTEVKRVKFSEMNRSPWQPLIAQEHMKEWYEALRKFSKLANSKDSVFRTLLSADTMLVFDNWRILHGRTAFKGERKLVGCYIPYEDWVAKARGIGAI